MVRAGSADMSWKRSTAARRTTSRCRLSKTSSFTSRRFRGSRRNSMLGRDRREEVGENPLFKKVYASQLGVR